MRYCRAMRQAAHPEGFPDVLVRDALAAARALPARTPVFAITGLQGSGKSTLARQIATQAEAAHLRVAVLLLCDGTRLVLRKLDADYDVHDRLAAMSFLQKHAAKGQVVTGLLYVEPDAEDLHAHLNTVDTPLNAMEAQDLCPGSTALEKINAGLR